MKDGRYSRKQFKMPAIGLAAFVASKNTSALDLDSSLSGYCEELARRYCEHLVKIGKAIKEADDKYSLVQPK